MLNLKTISAVKARQTLGQIMNEVALKNDQYIIERDGRPLAAVIPVWQLRQWLKQRRAFFQIAENMQTRSKKMRPEKVEAAIKEAVQTVRSRSAKNA